MDISEEESTPVLVERFPKESSSECEDSLKNQSMENYEKHLIQEVGSSDETFWGEKLTSVMNLEEILVGGHYQSNSKGERRHSRDSFKKNLKQNSDLMKHEKICAGKKPWKCNE